ncbi:MAG: hypothetical protein U0136_07775 [Bdellovibrionota bacterium]
MRRASEGNRADAGDSCPGRAAERGRSRSKTLEEAIAAQIRQDANARTEFIAAEVKKAEDEGDKKIAEEKAKAALAEKQRQAGAVRPRTRGKPPRRRRPSLARRLEAPR